MPLPRLHLFELEDLAWFPPVVRDLATDYLRFIETRLGLHKPILPLLRTMLERSNTPSVVDLCSGGGGPVLALYQALAAQNIHIQVTLTDKYPNTPAFQSISSQHPSAIRYVAHPVDATNVPANLPGLRTMFNAFHHFAPQSARLLLEDAVQARQPIAIFEIPERALRIMLLFSLTPILVLVATPFIRPFRWSRLLWTYLIPLVPFTCGWDGLVSAWRAYTVPEMRAFTHGLKDYDWKVDRIAVHGKAGHLTYLLGIPRSTTGACPPAAI